MKKPGKTYILQQDEHLQNLRKIIKRDFFQNQKEEQKIQTIQLSLNDYLANFKSNQNKVFSQLIQIDKEKWKKEHWWFEKQDKLLMLQNSKLKSNQKQYQNMIESDKNANGINKAITLQEAKNSIFFNRDRNFGSYLDQQYQNSKKVNYQNCRLDSQKQSKAKLKISNNKDKQFSDQENNQQVIMTWGQVQGTPIRLKGEDSYRIPQISDRQLVLQNLNEKILKNKKQQIKNPDKKSELLSKIIGSSTPKSSYQKSSYLRNQNSYPSSVRHNNETQKSRHIYKKKQIQQNRSQQKSNIMQGLLNFEIKK